MTEKKELIQQLKEADPDTYKQYRLEYMKSLLDLKKFQFLFLKNNQSRTWTEDYMKKLLSKRNDLLFDLSEIYHASLSAIYNDEFFKDNYYSLDEFLLKEKADRDYLKELSISDLSKAVQMKYSKICPIYFLNQAEKISFDVLKNVYQSIPDYLIPKNCKYFERASAEEILALIRANPFSLQSIPDHLITQQYVYHYLGLMIANERDEYIDQYVKIPMRFRDQNFYESYCIVFIRMKNTVKEHAKGPKKSKNAHWNIFFPNVKSSHPNMSGMSSVIHEPEFMQLKIQQEKCGEHPFRNFRKTYWKHQNGSCRQIL